MFLILRIIFAALLTKHSNNVLANQRIMRKITFKTFTWLLVAGIVLPVFTVGQATSMSGQKATVELTRNNQAQHNETNLSPDSPASEQWIHYDDTEMSDAWGFLISGEEYDIVAKWKASDIEDYEGYEITKVKFIVVNNQPFIKVKVWEGPNYTEIYSQDVPTYNVNSWTEVELDTPVPINTDEDLYVGYYVDMTHTELGGFVTATDDGPPEDDYGNLCYWDGGWYSDFNNHNLRVYIEPNLNADFMADEDTICQGGTVNFSNLSTAEETYLWTFEGGDPATSTDENPSVMYDTPGVYDVTLEVTLNGETDTEYKQDYIHVVELPAQADEPDGESETCTASSYSYQTNEVLYASGYEWELSPADAGTLTWDMNVAFLDTDDTWTGDFTLKVRAENVCGFGDWSDELEGSVSESPEEFNLEGGGGYCLGGDGVEITLDGSQSGVDYELYLGGEATGITAEGTGSEISFGLVTEEGYYVAIGSNGTCEYQMSGQIQVFVEYAPLEPSTPEGPESICEEPTAEYTTDEQDDADSFVWMLSPEEAGTIEGDGLLGTVTWNSEFSGMAYVSVAGINECGEGNPSSEIEVSVGAPNPEIDGESLVCDWSEEIYEVTENDGNTYNWTVNGGDIVEGQGTYTITVAWAGEGEGTVNVEEETEDGCLGASETFDVVLDDCTSLGENETGLSFSISPNPVKGNELKVYGSNLEGEYEVSIMDLTGKVVLVSTETENETRIDVSDLNSGLYFLIVRNEKGEKHVEKFIKN